MDVNFLKSLIGRLDDTCRNALQGAAGLCLARTNYDVDIEHLLVKLLDVSNSDLERILKYFEINPGRLVNDLTRALDKLKTGNARTPDSSNPLERNCPKSPPDRSKTAERKLLLLMVPVPEHPATAQQLRWVGRQKRSISLR